MVEDIRDGVIRAGKIFGCANFIYSEGNPVSKARRPPLLPLPPPCRRRSAPPRRRHKRAR
jgi:hypothetical protein